MHLPAVLRGAHAFLAPSHAMAGIPAELAERPRGESGHSIAEIVAHMAFWQDWFLDRCDGIAAPLPASAALGWPPVGTGGWHDAVARFEQGYERALALADDKVRAQVAVSPAIELEYFSRYTIGDALTHLALHNAHHLGQVILLRQLHGTWPPPAGSWTW